VIQRRDTTNAAAKPSQTNPGHIRMSTGMTTVRTETTRTKNNIKDESKRLTLVMPTKAQTMTAQTTKKTETMTATTITTGCHSRNNPVHDDRDKDNVERGEDKNIDQGMNKQAYLDAMCFSSMVCENCAHYDEQGCFHLARAQGRLCTLS
jgi:hypothetical protein